MYTKEKPVTLKTTFRNSRGWKEKRLGMFELVKQT